MSLHLSLKEIIIIISKCIIKKRKKIEKLESMDYILKSNLPPDECIVKILKIEREVDNLLNQLSAVVIAYNDKK